MQIRRHVLIVDDHAETVILMRCLLQRAGLRVFDARTKAEALACCDGESVDVLITDLLLPDGDGIDLLGTLSIKNPHVRGIAFSERDDATTGDQCRTAGFTAYMQKPINFDYLLNLIVGHGLGPFH